MFVWWTNPLLSGILCYTSSMGSICGLFDPGLLGCRAGFCSRGCWILGIIGIVWMLSGIGISFWGRLLLSCWKNLRNVILFSLPQIISIRLFMRSSLNLLAWPPVRMLDQYLCQLLQCQHVSLLNGSFYSINSSSDLSNARMLQQYHYIWSFDSIIELKVHLSFFSLVSFWCLSFIAIISVIFSI